MTSGGHNKGLKVVKGSNLPKKPAPPNRSPVPELRCPSGLSPVARAYWKRHAANLAKRGLLMASDRDSFKVLCEVYGLISDCMKTLREEGLVVDGKGGVKKHPASSVLNALLQQFRLLAAEFGLTPVSRERLGISPTFDQDREDEEWLFGPRDEE